jgi:transcriptional regulator with XRE-family HTH domain
MLIKGITTHIVVFKMNPTSRLPSLGDRLRKLRKKHYPNDTQKTFSFRIMVGKGTYVKMEKGDLSVSMVAYFRAAELLGDADSFDSLFKEEKLGLLEELGL